MPTVTCTDLAALKRISRARGREFDPERHTAWCAECGVPISSLGQPGGPMLVFGIMHWQNLKDGGPCLGDDDMIRFREVE